jgi:hypothetical protein
VIQQVAVLVCEIAQSLLVAVGINSKVLGLHASMLHLPVSTWASFVNLIALYRMDCHSRGLKILQRLFFTLG